MELMQRPPAIQDCGELVPCSLAGHVQLRDVFFKYPARPESQVRTPPRDSHETETLNPCRATCS